MEDGAHCEQPVRHLSDKHINHFVRANQVQYLVWLQIVWRFIRNYFEQRHDFRSAQVKYIVVKKVKV
jgi:hypothetical protein